MHQLDELVRVALRSQSFSKCNTTLLRIPWPATNPRRCDPRVFPSATRLTLREHQYGKMSAGRQDALTNVKRGRNPTSSTFTLRRTIASLGNCRVERRCDSQDGLPGRDRRECPCLWRWRWRLRDFPIDRLAQSILCTAMGLNGHLIEQMAFHNRGLLLSS